MPTSTQSLLTAIDQMLQEADSIKAECQEAKEKLQPDSDKIRQMANEALAKYTLL